MEDNNVILNYERVDFNNPATIINYGHEVKEKIVELFKKVIDNSNDYEELLLTDDVLKGIESFPEKLEKSDKKLSKKQNSLSYKIMKNFKSLVLKDEEPVLKANSFKEQYNEYLTNIEKARKIIESIMNGSLNDITTRRELYKSLIPFITILEEVINEGENDKEEFVKEIELEEQELNNLKLDITKYDSNKATDLDHSINLKRQYLLLFEERLNELKNNLAIYKENEAQFKIQEVNEQKIVFSAHSFLQDTSVMLELQASLYVGNYKQKNRTNAIQTLNETGNYSVRKSSELLRLNTESVNNLSLNKGISIETIQKISDDLNECLRIHLESRETRKIQIQLDKEAINSLNSKLDNNLSDFAYLNQDLGLTNLLSSNKSKVKKLTYKGTKRK